eukprot:gnl/MRDRNA2_/MRDRNA2_45604_c0_seq1.p1 gnl/MRDRNA2_/MRDRNA2_45604_c0~~gnl/MRDRNA2_/MRDRNA2_45604_c0_seq1.p1  ORF type:complete len:1365 (+),score=253.90 gnl/MRDRNA2_/MRDRNA2_45604_c0_seq1:133-4227(+)
MALYMATKIAIILSGLRLGVTYKPFLGLNELRPANMDAFCKEAADNSGLHQCSRKFHRELSDGGIVTMNWEVHMDPSTILSLDTEREKGVRLLACSEDSIELEVPETHESFIKEGKFVVGSHFSHNCEHLKGSRVSMNEPPEHLYARIESVERMGSNKVKLTYHESGTIAHVANHVRAYFEYSPAEARDLSEFPEHRTNAPPLSFKSNDEQERKLTAEGTWGHPLSEGHADGGFGAFQSLLDYVPEQVSNLGWNWDFELNTTSTPQVNYTLPGGEGSLTLKNPYVKAHAGIYFNFSSNLMNDFSKPPDVWFQLGLKGHGVISGKMNSELRIDDSVAGDPFNRHELPILRHLAGTMWLGTVEFAVGHLPVSFTPGVQFKAKAYHIGRFLGSLQAGIHTHAIINPSLEFSTATGMQSHFTGELLDTDLWPPSWLIYTDRFEMGMLYEPQLWIKGRMGSVKDAMWGLSLKPYFNISIMRSGTQTNPGIMEGSQLVVYPFRVTGLDGDDTYMVQIDANGKRAQSSVQMNFGILEYHDRPEAFRFGHITQNQLLQAPIKVTLKKGNETQTTDIGTQTVKCTELLNGECTPSPMEVEMTVDGKKVFVSLAAIWKQDPLPWFASKIRGVGISFPRITLRQDIMDTLKNSLITNSHDINLRVTRSGRIYDIPMSVNLTALQLGQTTTLLGNKMLEMGPTFLDAWKRCTDNMECSAPVVSLMHGETQLGSNTIPEIPWTSAQYNMQTYRGGFDMGTMEIPVHLALFAPANQFDSIGTASMNVEVTNPSSAAFFVYPIGATSVPVGDETAVIWSVGESKANVITFALTAMKVVNAKYVPMSDWSDLFAAQCSFNSVEMMEYHNQDNPCTFEHLVVWNKDHFKEGDRVVLRVEWQEMRDGIAVTHELFSSSFDIGGARKFNDIATNDANNAAILQDTDNGGTGRCVAIDGQEQYQAQCNLKKKEQCGLQLICEYKYDRLLEEDRRLTSMSDMWMTHMSELQAEDCTQNNLTFEVGAGLYIKSTLKHLTIPDKFPTIGGIAEAPDITSGYVSLTPNGPMINESFADLFPDELCLDGMCSGELPGCPTSKHDMRSYPRLTFNTSSNFSFYKDSSLSMQHLMAYAFSVLPEVVDVAVKSVGDWENGKEWSCIARPGQEVFQQACSQVPREACQHHVRCIWSKNVFTTTATPTFVPTNQQPVNAWHQPDMTQRLLAETEDEGIMTDTFEVSFNGGLPFIIDNQLMEVLMRHGAFDDMKEVHPDLHIVGFDITHEVRAGDEDNDLWEDSEDKLNRPQMRQSIEQHGHSRAPFTLSLVVFLVATGMIVAVGINTRKKYHRVSSEANLEEGSESDEGSAASEAASEEQRWTRAQNPPRSLYQ